MFFWDRFLTRGRLPISSFLCFIGGFSMGSWLTLFHQLQLERDLSQEEFSIHTQQSLLLLAVLIISAPKNFDRRNTLRSSWLRLNRNSKQIKHFFIVGAEGLSHDLAQRLKREQTVEGDLIILPDLIDSYDNLTLKLTLGLDHLSSQYPFNYVLKCDDDSFARLDILETELSARRISLGYKELDSCFYWGFFDGRARVQKNGKWKEEEYNLCDLYIPYALGGGYILSKKCVDYINKNRAYLRKFQNEDVSVGTWLASVVHDKKHDIRFDTEYESRGCNNGHLVQHKISQAEMVARYKNVIAKRSLCTEEIRRRSPYEYDFHAPPSQCCKRDPLLI